MNITINVADVLLFMIFILIIGFIYMMRIIWKVSKWSKMLSKYNEFLERKYGDEFVQFLIDSEFKTESEFD